MGLQLAMSELRTSCKTFRKKYLLVLWFCDAVTDSILQWFFIKVMHLFRSKDPHINVENFLKQNVRTSIVTIKTWHSVWEVCETLWDGFWELPFVRWITQWLEIIWRKLKFDKVNNNVCQRIVQDIRVSAKSIQVLVV